MENLKKFTSMLSGEIEYNNFTKAITFDEAIKNKTEGVYFLGGVKDTTKRNKDEDIVSKNYFYVDFDVRKEIKHIENRIIDDKELARKGEEIVLKLEGHPLYREWSVVINTGNGFHFYYIGDEVEIINKQIHALGLKRIFEDIKEFLNCDYLVPDNACCNIGRIARLPGSMNFARKDKYGLEPKEARIIGLENNKARIVSMILPTGKQELEKKATQEEKYNTTITKREHKTDLIDEILKLPMADMICDDFGFTLCDDKKNFTHPIRPGNQGLFLGKDENGNDIMINTGSHFLSERGFNKKGYNMFSYIKQRENLNNHQTFNRFKDNYPTLKEHNGRKEEPAREIKIDKEPVKDLENLLYGKRFTWGTDKINETFALLSQGTYTVIAGETGDGKTTFAYFQAIQNARMGHNVLYLSLEMSNEELLKSIATKRAGITTNELYYNKIPESKIIKFKEKIKEIQKIKKLTTAGMRKGEATNIGSIEQIVKKENPDIVYIDNFDLIEIKEKEENKTQREISMKLMSMATDLNIPVVLLHHYRKKQTNSKTQKRSIDDIGGNRKITHDADRVIHLYRSKEEDNKTTLYLAKVRGGDKALVDIYFDKGEFVDEREKETMWFHK